MEHLQAIDNLEWENNTYKSDNSDVQIANAREMFKHATVHTVLVEAMAHAVKIENDIGYTEYGLCIIVIERIF